MAANHHPRMHGVQAHLDHARQFESPEDFLINGLQDVRYGVPAHATHFKRYWIQDKWTGDELVTAVKALVKRHLVVNREGEYYLA